MVLISQPIKNPLFSKGNDGLKLAHFFFIAATFTSSFDIFLVFNFGFNFRATQFFLIIPIFISVMISIRYKTIWPLGFNWVVFWTFFIVLFVPNTNYLTKSVGYAAWLVFDVLIIYTCCQIYSSIPRVLILLKWYVYSFLFVALFGILQFISPTFGFGDALLIKTWWIPDVLPRVNGFSYEPSFYATYLLIGWVFLACLLESKSKIFNLHKLRWIFYIISISLLICGSRMVILMMMVWFARYPINFFIRIFYGKINLYYGLVTFLIASFLLVLIFSAFYFVGFDDILFLLSGTGLFGIASHSVDTRQARMLETFTLFLNSPFIGYSLGGIAPAIAETYGVTNLDFDSVKEFEGNSIFVEVLAASGVFGIIPFIFYLWAIIKKPIELSKKLMSEHSKILIGLTVALIFEFVILQFNQVILRPYLWMHIAVLSACYSAFKAKSCMV